MRPRDPADEAFDEFLRRYREGRLGDVEAFLAGYPALAARLRPRLQVVLGLGSVLGGPPERSPASPRRARHAQPRRSAKPRRLGPFLLHGALGEGSMGTVHVAEVQEQVEGVERGERVALKLFKPALIGRAELLARFVRETRIGRAFDHENLARTRATGEVRLDGQRVPYLVMDLLEGEDLGRRLDREGPQGEAFVRSLALGVARGLAALSAAGVVHRDLKPSNVMVLPSGAFKVMDFGLAGLLDPDAALTQSGTFVGAVLYAAPEQLLRRRGVVDARADLYALGLLLYEVWVGDLPWPAEPIALALERRSREPAPRPARQRPGLPPFLDAVIATLLDPDPSGRFGSAAALLGVLSDGEAGPWWRAQRPQAPKP